MEVEKAFRVHLLVSRRMMVEDDPPDKSTSGFVEIVLVVVVVCIAFDQSGGIPGSINMSTTPSPFGPNTGNDHTHLALSSLIQQRRRRFPVCFIDGMDHNRTVP